MVHHWQDYQGWCGCLTCCYDVIFIVIGVSPIFVHKLGWTLPQDQLIYFCKYLWEKKSLKALIFARKALMSFCVEGIRKYLCWFHFTKLHPSPPQTQMRAHIHTNTKKTTVIRAKGWVTSFISFNEITSVPCQRRLPKNNGKNSLMSGEEGQEQIKSWPIQHTHLLRFYKLPGMYQ